jgi:hypothetical protein
MSAQVLTHPAALNRARCEVRAALRKYADLRDGVTRWDEEYREMFTASHSPQEDAVGQAWAELEEARAHLAALKAQARGAA